MSSQGHSYHMVEMSPWPLVSSLGAFIMTSGAVYWFSSGSYTNFLIGLTVLLLVMIQWWRDVVREGSFQGHHTLIVEKGLRWGMILFIVSEVLFFFSFFWAFYHSSLSPSVEIGGVWPPLGIVPFNCFEVPLLNTVILLSSGVLVTWSHHALMEGYLSSGVESLFLTVLLGVVFTFFQGVEYYEAFFSFADSVYGSTFFIATGFHGLHVIIGTIFLMVSLFRMMNYHYSEEHHFGFEAAAWYWHFVDVVWLFLYVSIYWWGG